MNATGPRLQGVGNVPINQSQQHCCVPSHGRCDQRQSGNYFTFFATTVLPGNSPLGFMVSSFRRRRLCLRGRTSCHRLRPIHHERYLVTGDLSFADLYGRALGGLPGAGQLLAILFEDVINLDLPWGVCKSAFQLPVMSAADATAATITNNRTDFTS